MKLQRSLKPVITFCTAYFLCIGCGYAQVSKADSLAVFAKINKAEFYFDQSKYDSALWYCADAESLSKKLGFKKGRAYSLIEATDIYIDKDDLVKAEQANAVVSKAGAELKDSLIIAINHLQLAQIRMYNGKYDEAVPIFEDCLSFLSTHPTLYTALAYNDLGFTYGQKGDFSRQADNLLKSVSVYEKYFPEKTDELAIALNNVASLYFNVNNRDKAIEYAKLALAYREKTGDPDKLSLTCCNLCQYYIGSDNAEADKYLQQCVKYALQSKKENRITHSYVTAAFLYGTTNQPEKALGYEIKAIDILERSKKDPQMLARRYLSAGTLCRTLKKDSLIVLSWFNKSLGVLNAQPNKINLRDFYQQLSNYYHESGNNDAALENYKKYILYKDSLMSEKTESSISEIATRYETAKKDNEISKLNTEQRIRLLEIEKQKALIAGNDAEAKQKQNEITLLSQEHELQDAKIKQQGEELEKQQLVSENNTQQLKLTQQEKQLRDSELKTRKQWQNMLIGGAIALMLFAGFMFNRYRLKKAFDRQKELLDVRNNIARDLHDEIGSALTSIKILSEVSRNNLQKDQQRSSTMLSQITEQSDRMQQGMSDIVWAIKPDNDKLENMLVRMREYAVFALEPKNIAAVFRVDEQLLAKSLDMQQRRDVFLIYKEAVNNAAKYSGAARVEISLYREGGNILLKISDNGKGFEPGGETSSNGLKNIRSRAAMLGGKAMIVSALSAGTQITVEVPAT